MRRLAPALLLAAASLTPFACVYDWTVEPAEGGGGGTSAPSSTSSSPTTTSTHATGPGTGGAAMGGPSSSTANTSTGASSTTGSGGGGAAGNDLGGSGGGSTTVSTGSFGVTGCPGDAHVPDAGAACGPVGIICEYGVKGDKNDPRPSCRDDFECNDAGVLSPTQTADGTSCDVVPDCPDAGGTSCNGAQQCRIGNDVICYCINSSYSCSDTQGAGGGCPTYYPNQGQPCTFLHPTTCHYGLCGESDYVIRTCTNDVWVDGAASGSCDAGAGQN